MSPGYDTLIQCRGSAQPAGIVSRITAAQGTRRQLIGELGAEIAWFSVPGGVRLHSTGEVADSLYVIVNGAFAIYAAQPSGGRDSREPPSRSW